MYIDFRKALIVSGILHVGILFFTWPGRHTILRVPLSVELIKVASPSAEAGAEQQEPEPAAVPKKEKKKETKKEAIKKETKKNVDIKTTPGTGSSELTTSLNLDGAKFPYLYYLNLIRRKIAEQWDWPGGQGVFKTIIYFRIQQDGEIAGLSFKQRSSNQLFDDAALRAVQIAGPFSPLPGGYTEDSLGVYFEFSFR
jgi:TonB family protein